MSISGFVWSLYSIKVRKNVVTFRTVLASFAMLKCLTVVVEKGVIIDLRETKIK
jgi:hypothetical protein